MPGGICPAEVSPATFLNFFENRANRKKRCQRKSSGEHHREQRPSYQPNMHRRRGDKGVRKDIGKLASLPKESRGRESMLLKKRQCVLKELAH